MEKNSVKILFTKKKLDQKLISKVLLEGFETDFLEVITTQKLSIEPFPLKNKSLIFTSVNAVEAFFENGFLPNEKFTDKNFNKIYGVGSKTKKKLREFGFGTFKMEKHAEDLAQFIFATKTKEKFLHFCGNLSLPIFEETLHDKDIFYKKIEIYETKMLYPTYKNDFDAIVFFSPSGVRSFLKFNSTENKFIFSIGNTTTKELKKYTSKKIFTSKESNLQDILELINKKLGQPISYNNYD